MNVNAFWLKTAALSAWGIDKAKRHADAPNTNRVATKFMCLDNQTVKSPEEIAEGNRRFMERQDALIAAINKHPALAIQHRWQLVRRLYEDVLGGNIRDLVFLLDKPNRDTELALQLMVDTPDVTPTQQRYEAEVDRRLHNLVSAAGTLLVYSKRLVAGHYDGTEFAAEWQKRDEELRRLPVVRFVHDLRNFTMHERLAPFVQQFTITDSIKHSVRLSVRSLLQNGVTSKWSGPAKVYAAAAPEEGLDLKSAVVEYSDAVHALYTWLFIRFDEMHGVTIEDVNRLIDEYNEPFVRRSRRG